MGTIIIIAIGAWLLIGAQQRAAIVASLAASIQNTPASVATSLNGEEIPYGGAADTIPNSNGFNPNPGPGLQVMSLGTPGTHGLNASDYLSPSVSAAEEAAGVAGLQQLQNSPFSRPI